MEPINKHSKNNNNKNNDLFGLHSSNERCEAFMKRSLKNDINNDCSNTSECDGDTMTFKQRFECLYQSLEKKRSDRSFTIRLPRFKDIGKYIYCNYFYETAARFDSEERKRYFYDSLRIGDKFVAKVINVHNRYADVHLVWSYKRDISDLKLKANLRLDSHSRNNNNDNHFIEQSELMNVELINFDKKSLRMDVIQCSDSNDKHNQNNDNEEIDETSIRSGKYRTIKPHQQSFDDYMNDHDDLRNPSLIKLHPFTSLKNFKHTIKCIEHRNDVKKKKIEEKVESTTTKTNDNTPITKPNKNHSECSSSSAASSLVSKKHAKRSSSSSSSESDSSDSDSSRSTKRKKKKLKKHKNKKHRSNHHHRHHKSKKSKHRSSSLSSDSEQNKRRKKIRSTSKESKHRHHNKIDNKILQLLKFN